jgi:hypothetical protein
VCKLELSFSPGFSLGFTCTLSFCPGLSLGFSCEFEIPKPIIKFKTDLGHSTRSLSLPVLTLSTHDRAQRRFRCK